jgi:hypothetical protein
VSRKQERGSEGVLQEKLGWLARDSSSPDSTSSGAPGVPSIHNMWPLQGETLHVLLLLRPVHIHQRLYDRARWKNLIESFRLSVYSLNTLPTEPLLNLSLYAGLASLKLPACYDESTKNIDCPVCDGDGKSSSSGLGLGKLANDVPWSHHANSTIVCHITGKIMDEDNMPMAFPNGHVYSREVNLPLIQFLILTLSVLGSRRDGR